MDQLTTEGTEKSEATKRHKKHKRFINGDRGFSLTVCASCAFSWLILFVLLCALCGKKALSFPAVRFFGGGAHLVVNTYDCD